MTPVTFSAIGGRLPYVWSIDAATPLPAGMSFNAATATLSGTPTAAPGSYNFIVKMLDGNDCPSSKSYSLIVQCATVTVSTAALPPAVVGRACGASLTASTVGTSVPAQTYVWSLASGTLPEGFRWPRMASSSGTPTSATTANLTLRVRNPGRLRRHTLLAAECGLSRDDHDASCTE